MPTHYRPGLKVDWRQRLCLLTKDDLLDFDHDFLRPKFPDLFRFEWSRLNNFLKIYDSLAEVDREVQFCERWPEDVPRIIITPPKDRRRRGFQRHGDLPSIRILVAQQGIVDLRKVEPSDNVRPIDFVGRRFERFEDMQGCFPRGDKAAKKFFDAVFRLSAKFMTNSFEWYNLETGDLVKKVTGTVDWCGPDGIRLGRKDPDFYAYVIFSREFGTWCGAKAIPKK